MRALIVEDEQRLARFFARMLSEEGLTVDACTHGADAVARAEGSLYDLIVLDWRPPQTDGPKVCREIRRGGDKTPILMLTADGHTRERVLGLEAGADACMLKPIEVDEFVARVRALLRRSMWFEAARYGDLAVDRSTRTAKLAGEEVVLTHREYALLVHLLRRADEIVERTELVAQVWGMRFDPGSNLVEVLVSRLRGKFGTRAWMIETVRGVGYRLCRQRPATGGIQLAPGRNVPGRGRRTASVTRA
jgi:DNA-binding response OmpR family regulator